MNYKVFESFPDLVTERLTLQLHEERDVDSLFELRSDPDVMAYMDMPMATDKSVVLERIREIRKDFQDKKGINWTIKLKNSSVAIGYMSLWRIDHANHRAEIGYALQKEYWKKGISFEAAKKVIDFAFDELKVHNIMANINPKNKSSEGLLLKLGFRQEAYFREDFFFEGKFTDSAIFSLLVSDWKQ